MQIPSMSAAQIASKADLTAILTPITDPAQIQPAIDAFHALHGRGPWCGSDDCLAEFGFQGPLIDVPDNSAAPPPSADALWEGTRVLRRDALLYITEIAMRCQLAMVTFPAAWQDYYVAWRDIESQPFPPTLPTQPPIPGGI